MRQQAERGDSLGPGDTASSSQQSDRLDPGAPANTPAGGSPGNNPRTLPPPDAGDEVVPGFVVPYYYQNYNENNTDVGLCYVKIQLLGEPARGPVTLRGEVATYYQETLGREWSHNMALWVRFQGANIIEITRR